MRSGIRIYELLNLRLQQVRGPALMSSTAVYLQFNDKDLQVIYAKCRFA